MISLCSSCQGLYAAPTTADEVSSSSDSESMPARPAPAAKKQSAKTSQVVQIGVEHSTTAKGSKSGGKRRGAAEGSASNKSAAGAARDVDTKESDHDSSYDESGDEDRDDEQVFDAKAPDEDEETASKRRRVTVAKPTGRPAGREAAAETGKKKRPRTPKATTKARVAAVAGKKVDDEDQGDDAEEDPQVVRHQPLLETIRDKWQQMQVEASHIIVKSRRELVDEFNAPAVQQARLAVSIANEKLRVAGFDPAHACAESDLVGITFPPLLLKSICASCKEISIDEDELLLYFAISLQLGVLGKTADSFVAANSKWHAHMPHVFTGPQSQQVMTLKRFKQIQRSLQISTPVLPQECPLHAFDSFLQAKQLHSMVLETIVPMVSAALDDNMLPTQGRDAPCKKMSLRKTYPSGVVMDFVVASFLAIPLACRFRLTGESAQASALNMLSQVSAIDNSNIRLILDRGFGSIVLALMFAAKANSLFAIVNDGDRQFPIGSELYRKFYMPEGRGFGCHEVQVCWLPSDAKTNPNVILAIAVREGAGKSGTKKDTKLLKMVTTEANLLRYAATYARVPWVVEPEERKYDLINTSVREQRTARTANAGSSLAAAGARDGSKDQPELESEDDSKSDSDSSFAPSVASSDEDIEDSDLARSESDWSSESDDDTDGKSDEDVGMYHNEGPADFVSDSDEDGQAEEQKQPSRVEAAIGAPPNLPRVAASVGIPTDQAQAQLIAALRREIEQECHILTETQREASWHTLRRFHLTGTSVYPILNKYKLFRARQGKDRLMGFWKVLVSSWFDSRKRSTSSMKLGHVNETRVIDALAARPDLSTVRTVGLLESKAHPFLAISPDGMCIYKGRMTPIEIKTKTTRATEAEAEMIAVRYCERSSLSGPRVRDVALSDEDVFHTLVPSAAYRMQLMHSLLTTGTKSILFVAAALAPKEPLIYIVRITVHSARCKAVLTAFKAELLGLASYVRFHEVFQHAYVPDVVPPEHYENWRTHVKFFVGLRNHALKKALPPTRTFKHALQVLYNTGKGGVDIVSRHEQTIEGNDSRRVSFDHLVANRAIQDSLLAAWAVRKSALTLARSDPSTLTASTLREKNNRQIDLVDFVERVSLQWLEKATARRSAAQMNTTCSVERLLQLHMEFDTPRSKRGLEFFNSTVGLELRSFVGPHDLEPAGKQNWCVLGHCASLNKRGSKTTNRCKTCRAALCDTCHVKFHSDRNRKWVHLSVHGPSPDSLNTPAASQRAEAASAVPGADGSQPRQAPSQLASPPPPRAAAGSPVGAAAPASPIELEDAVVVPPSAVQPAQVAAAEEPVVQVAAAEAPAAAAALLALHEIQDVQEAAEKPPAAAGLPKSTRGGVRPAGAKRRLADG